MAFSSGRQGPGILFIPIRPQLFGVINPTPSINEFSSSKRCHEE